MAEDPLSPLLTALRAVELEGSSWAEALALSPADRARLVPLVKQELDSLVRVAPPQALELGQRLVDLARGTGARLEALAQRGQAVAWHFNGKNAEAHAGFERAAELHLAAEEPLQAAIAWRSLVEVCHQLGRRDEALQQAARARAVFEQLGAEQLLAELDVNVGNVLVRIDEYPAADEHYSRALARFEGLNHAVGISYCRFNLAVVAMNLSELDLAQDRWRAARAGMAAAGQVLHVADCDYNLAYLLSRSGDFRGAITQLEAARKLYRQNGKPSGVPLCDLDLAEIHLRLGALELAQEHAQRAATAFADLELELERGRAELIQGLALARRGSQAAARRAIEQAGLRFQAVGNRNSSAIAQLELAALEIDRGQAQPALLRAQAARHQFEERELKLLSALAGLVAARAELALGRFEAALVELERLAQMPERAGLGGLVHLERLCLTARAEERLGRSDRAILRLQEALAHMEQAYPAIPGQEIRLAFLREQHAAFVDLVFLLGRRNQPGDAHEALRVLEDGRLHSHESQALELSLASSEVRSARQRIELLLARRLDSELGISAQGTQVRGAAPDDGQLESAWQTYRRAKVQSAPERGNLRQRLELLEAACPPGERLVAYAVGSRGALALVAEEGRVRSVTLPTGAEDLSGWIDRLRFHMDRLRLGGVFLGSRALQFERTSEAIFAALGARLLEPLFEHDDPRPLTLLPYGVLHDLPFQAFRIGGRALIERAAVSFAPGLASLAHARSHRYPNRGPLLLMDAGGGLNETASELAELEGLFPGRSSRVALADFADPQRFHCPDGASLHVAGHGLFVPEHPQFSALSDGQRFVFAHELPARRLPLNLVVLSGCETGRQGGVEAEELVGLSRAFLSAGARAVLASLWPVEDLPARWFMSDFYGRLATGLQAREALAQVQRAWIAGNPLTDQPKLDSTGQDGGVARRLPHLWAAFALTGDPTA